MNGKTKTVLITEKEFEKAKDVWSVRAGFRCLPVPDDEESLAGEIRARSVRAVVVGAGRYAGPLYEALVETAAAGSGENRPGALIVRFGVGHDGIDKELCRRHGIMLANTPGVLDRSVAEHTFWLLGVLLRHVAAGNDALRRGDFPIMTGTELYGKALLVVGAGPIGREVAKIARFGFGMRVLASGRPNLETFAARLGCTVGELPAVHGIDRYENDADILLPEADVVSSHLASTPETKRFFDAARFEKMKSRAVLVNTARGALVDEAALFDALKNRRIAGAALDVFETEPYVPVDKRKDLRTLDNVVLTPHLGSSTAEANCRMASVSLRCVERFLENRVEEIASRIV